MGGFFSAPKRPAPPPPPPPLPDPEEEARKRRLAALERRRRGRDGTIRTSSKGLLDPINAAFGQKTLLGG